MKRILIILFGIISAANMVYAQENHPDIVFSKFKLEWFNAMGMRGGGDGQRLKLTFKNKSDKPIKYINVHYWAINAVNDIATDRFGRNEFSVECTGPFNPKKQIKLEVKIALFHPNLLNAYPYKIEIIGMDGEEKEIEINKDNINTIFPCVEYINIGSTEHLKSPPKEDDMYSMSLE